MFVLAIFAIACNKNPNESTMKVRMTDAPGDYDKVLVEIIGVEIHYTGENESAWMALETNAGIYDLLLLQNNVSAVLTEEGKIPAGKVDQIRLILGANNSVVVEGIEFDLKTPSAQNTGLKINVNQTFKADNKYEVLLDFDADKSIVVEGNGAFSLKPVISLKSVVEF